MDALPTIADVHAAAARIHGETVRTPAISSPLLDEISGARVFLKCENLQRTGSFKFRGAYNAIAAMAPQRREQGIVAVSSGNHAQAVAEAARLFGLRSTIIMPADAPALKRERTERSGGRVITYDRAHDDRDAVALKVLAERGGVLVHPYNDADVIAGQGTLGLELIEQMAEITAVPDAVVIPCGGGGLSAGVGLAVRAEVSDVAVLLVEPTGFDDYGRSLVEGTRVANKGAAGSICDALLAPSPGAISFAISQANHARGLVVSDDEALAAVAFAFRELKLVIEPGGAVALAAVLARRLPAFAGGTIAVVLSGGNIEPAMLQRALAV